MTLVSGHVTLVSGHVTLVSGHVTLVSDHVTIDWWKKIAVLFPHPEHEFLPSTVAS